MALIPGNPQPLTRGLANGLFLQRSNNLSDLASASTARTNLGLGTIATQNANNVSISGGAISGITDLAIADGGTGQSTAQAAINALTAVSGATIGHVLTKSTGGDAVWEAAAGGSSLPVADTQTIIKGSADATKLLRFEVDGFTSGATRVITPPNADITLAGQNFANTFTQDQTLSNKDVIFTPASGGTRGLSSIVTDSKLLFGYINLTTFAVAGAYFQVYGNNISTAATRRGGAEFVIDTTNDATDFNIIRFKPPDTWLNIAQFRTDEPALSLTPVDATVTNTIYTMLQFNLRSTGTPTTGFGPSILFNGKSSTTNDQPMARINAIWQTATHASAVADILAQAYYNNSGTFTASEIWRGRAGADPAFSVLGAMPITRQAHIADPSGGGTQDAEARTAINAILLLLEGFGFAATS